MDTTEIFVQTELPRPPFAIIAYFLWGNDVDFDSDGNSETPSDTTWKELTLINREGKNERLDIDPISQSPLILRVASEDPALATKAAYFLGVTTDGKISSTLPGGNWRNPEFLLNTVHDFNAPKATLEAILICHDDYPDATIQEPDYVKAHKKSSRHRDEIFKSFKCGCFYCLQNFQANEISIWIDECNGIGQTAVCPKCGVDSVISSASGYPITEDFLKKMKDCWFSF